MSKSLGNVVVPQEVTGKLGAEILRLWVASTDYSGELSISKEILDRVVEVYRRVRNTLRFLLANTADFDIARDAVPLEQWMDLDRYALAFTRQLAQQAEADYAKMEFHRIVQALQVFCAEDLGAFYLDILKDRLYTTAADSLPRRAAQTALWHITQTLLKLMAPILSFTAEEAWAILNPARAGGEPDSVMLHTFHALPAQEGEAGLIARWETIRAVRAEGLKVIEALRTEGKVGASLQAELELAPERRQARGDGQPGRGPALRHHDLRRAPRRGRPHRGRAHRRHPERAAEVRALLALRRIGRQRRRTSQPVRPLREQPVRRGRDAQPCLTSCPACSPPPPARWRSRWRRGSCSPCWWRCSTSSPSNGSSTASFRGR